MICLCCITGLHCSLGSELNTSTLWYAHCHIMQHQQCCLGCVSLDLRLLNGLNWSVFITCDVGFILNFSVYILINVSLCSLGWTWTYNLDKAGSNLQSSVCLYLSSFSRLKSLPWRLFQGKALKFRLGYVLFMKQHLTTL